METFAYTFVPSILLLFTLSIYFKIIYYDLEFMNIFDFIENFKENYKFLGFKYACGKFFHPIIWPVKSFFRSLINIFIWLPVIWTDYDWDFKNFLIIVRFKIKRMRLYLSKCNQAEIKKKLSKMKACEKILDNLIKEDYDNLEERNKDLKKLLNLIEENVFSWWD